MRLLLTAALLATTVAAQSQQLPPDTAAKVATPVLTTQVAPTILHALGLDPTKLQAVVAEGTQVLPSLPY